MNRYSADILVYCCPGKGQRYVMNIYELSYAAAVMCYRNIDVLEERHSVCGKADEELYEIIHEEFGRKLDMMVKVLTEFASNEEEKDFLIHFVMCIGGYRQWDEPQMVNAPENESLSDYILKDVKLACNEHKKLTEEMMKTLNRSVHDRLFTWFMYYPL